MEANYSQYDYEKSRERISEILDSSDAGYEQHKGIPSREKLTFTNGYYVDVTVLFVDMRDSKSLAKKHTRPVLAKIYRVYISEIVALLRDNVNISEIYIEGDGVWGVFNTITKNDIDSVFSTAASISSLIDTINIKLLKKKYSTINIGIGIDDGDSLYIKAGYKGGSVNEVVWIGHVVGEAANLCSNGNKTYLDGEIMVSEMVYGNLNDHNKSLLKWNASRGCYNGNVVNLKMNEWVEKNG